MEHCSLTDTSRNNMNVCWVLWWGPLFVRVTLQTLLKVQGLVSTSSPKPWHVQKKAVSKGYKICFIHRRTGQRTQHTCTIQAIDCTGTPQCKLRHKPLDAFKPSVKTENILSPTSSLHNTITWTHMTARLSQWMLAREPSYMRRTSLFKHARHLYPLSAQPHN